MTVVDREEKVMAKNLTITVETGRHERPEGLLSAAMPEGVKAEGMLVDTRAPQDALPYQVLDGMLYFAAPRMPAKKTVTFEFRADKSVPARLGTAEAVEKEGKLDFLMKGKLFTSYNYKPAPAPKPYFYPVMGPRDIPVTRGWPMDPQKGDVEDHPHHKSIYVSHGDINGVDVWSEEKGHGGQKHEQFMRLVSGPFVSGFDEKLTWHDKDGKPLMGEVRTVRLYNLPWNLRVMDIGVKFVAEHGPVTFGDTKEGGIISVRVATPMNGNKTGLIENAFGGKGEAECWGKPSPWVDYSGMVKGKRLGIAVFDHCNNLRHPARWHVRDYGLFALNPFALSHYKYGRDTDGSYRLEAGKELAFSFRIVIHQNDAVRGKIKESYLTYAFPPKIGIV
jgi:hypothetical protein